MSPVRQQGSNKDIGHARQEIGLRQQLIVIAYTIEQGGLGEQDDKSEDRVYDGAMTKSGIQAMDDEPVQIIVFRM